MTEAIFSDDLYHGMCNGGAGLYGSCARAAWFYERHSLFCTPGKWLVGIAANESGEFWPLTMTRADAVVDDFGNLRKVTA